MGHVVKNISHLIIEKRAQQQRRDNVESSRILNERYQDTCTGTPIATRQHSTTADSSKSFLYRRGCNLYTFKNVRHAVGS